MAQNKILAVTMGDRYGVGPELVARLAETVEPAEGISAVIVGDPAVLEAGGQVSGVTRRPTTVVSFSEASAARYGWSFLPLRFALATGPMGAVSADSGREMLATLQHLASAATRREIDGIVYAPLNKQAMRLAGHEAGDELDFFSKRLPVPGMTGEINILGALWTSRVTSHVPLRAVGDLITADNVLRGIDMLASALRRSGKATPRIAVAALNPHAGEGGAFGREEIDVIGPAVAAAKAQGLDVEGPFPSDTIFPRAMAGSFDGVVTMFHDQGQIALKLLGLGKGITLLAGFPIPIATPGHGTAYDIAGQGTARIDGIAAAVALVSGMLGSN